MAIEKMSMVTVDGRVKYLDTALAVCCESGVFQIVERGARLRNLNEQNPYIEVYNRMRGMADNLGIPPRFCAYKDVPYETREDFEGYISGIDERYEQLKARYDEVCASLAEHIDTDAYLKHLLGLNVDFRDLFSLKYVKIRIGKLPVESEKKLEYYANKSIVFVPFERDKQYVWGLYLVPTSRWEFADALMNSLCFERTRLPDYLEDNAEGADKKLAEEIAAEQAEKKRIEDELSHFADDIKERFAAVMSKLKYKTECFELRKKAIIADGSFSIAGYCPSSECEALSKKLAEAGAIKTLVIPVDKKTAPPDVPIRLKNNIITRPFEMFVNMYGLPSYRGFDPTPYVAVTYCLLFGIMFGDVGQGLLVSLLGFILSRVSKNGLAPIMMRIGLFSAAFGVLYGSVFGIESLITPFYHRENIWNGLCKALSALGLPEHPATIFEAAMVVLAFSLLIGVVLILLSMIFNMVLKLGEKNPYEAIFSVNGLCGITFYVAVVAGAVLLLLYGINLFSVPYILFLIVLPVLLIFFKHPIINALTGTKPEEKTSVGNFIIENFIEMFETMISFLSNTMSYLRVGGFVLSHAGFMLVVSQLAGTANGDAEVTAKTVIVYIIGNILVMGIEGLLVGIQVLRLEFYEIFNRFFDASGKAFAPVKISFETDK